MPQLIHIDQYNQYYTYFCYGCIDSAGRNRYIFGYFEFKNYDHDYIQHSNQIPYNPGQIFHVAFNGGYTWYLIDLLDFKIYDNHEEMIKCMLIDYGFIDRLKNSILPIQPMLEALDIYLFTTEKQRALDCL